DEDYFAVFAADFLTNKPADHPYARLMAALSTEFQWFVPIPVEKNKFSNDQWGLMQKNGWLESESADAAMLSANAWEEGNTLGIENAEAETAIRAVLEN